MPPKITAKATGTVAFLGDDVLSAKNVAPTLLVNYHFGAPATRWRPYVGAGINYTKFVSVKSKLATDVKMSDSTGLAVQLGVDYALSKDWGLFASVAKVQTKSQARRHGHDRADDRDRLPADHLLVRRCRTGSDGCGAAAPQRPPPRPSTIFIVRMQAASASVMKFATITGQAPSITP